MMESDVVVKKAAVCTLVQRWRRGRAGNFRFDEKESKDIVSSH